MLLWHDSWHPDVPLFSKKNTWILFPRCPLYISATCLLKHLSKQRLKRLFMFFFLFHARKPVKPTILCLFSLFLFFLSLSLIFLLKSCTPPYDIKNFCKAMNFSFWINLSISILSKKFFSFSHHSTEYNQLHIERAMHP